MFAKKAVFTLSTILLSSVFLTTSAWAAHDPCKILTAEKVAETMGFAVTIDRNGSNEMNCYYSGPGKFGAQFHIISETASPQMDAMLDRRGSSPPPGSGMIGGSYREGTTFFSLSMRSNDQAKLAALVASIRTSLK